MTWVRTAVLGCSALVLAACTSSAPHHRVVPRPAHPSRPNIVFVLTDDLSTDLIQYMPHVAAMQQSGTTFSNYFVTDSLCCPSRASIFTGEYPHNDGVYTNGKPDGGYGAFQRNHDAKRTFALALQRAGYRTALLGKYLNKYQPKADPPPRGWSEWDVAGFGYDEYDYDLNEDRTVHHYGHDPSDYLTDVLDAKAQDFVTSSAGQGKPFLLEVATFAPHEPATPAPRDVGAFPVLHTPRGPAFGRAPANAPAWLARLPPLAPSDEAAMDAQYRKRVESVQAVDDLIGHLQRTIVAEGLADDTYFVFSSDNGYHMGQYRMLPGKHTAFDTDIRVPLVVAGPGVPAGATNPTTTSELDLAPTFEEIGGAAPTGERDGASMLSLWHGEPAPVGWPSTVLVEHRGPDDVTGDPDAQMYRQGLPPSYEAMRMPHALFVEYVDGTHEYYDLTRDPNELDNRAATLSLARLAQLQNALHRLEACSGAECQAAARFG